MSMPVRFSSFMREWKGGRTLAACAQAVFRSDECIGRWVEGDSTPARPSFPMLAPLLGTTVDNLAAMVEAERTARAATRMVDVGGVTPILDACEGSTDAVASPEASGAFHE
jgi:hypothetical protein